MYNFESPEINTTDITKTILRSRFPFTNLKKKKKKVKLFFSCSTRDLKKKQKIKEEKKTTEKIAEKILISSKKQGKM